MNDKYTGIRWKMAIPHHIQRCIEQLACVHKIGRYTCSPIKIIDKVQQLRSMTGISSEMVRRRQNGNAYYLLAGGGSGSQTFAGGACTDCA